MVLLPYLLSLRATYTLEMNPIQCSVVQCSAVQCRSGDWKGLSHASLLLAPDCQLVLKLQSSPTVAFFVLELYKEQLSTVG